MKIVVAMFKHETNTFSPLPTRWRDFGADGPWLGRAAYDEFHGSGLAMAGLLEVAEEHGAEIETPIAARAMPSAPVEQETFDRVARVICDAVERGCDALFLDLHGAMVTEAYDDGEGELLRRIRRVAPALPIAVALDLHANVTEQMVGQCTTLVGYQTYPHVDMPRTGERAARVLMEALAGRVRPVLAWQRCPILPNMLRQATDDGPMSRLVASARRAETEGALAVTVFGGFPLADTPGTGLSVVAMTDGSRERARAICEGIVSEAWAARREFDVSFEPLADSIARARRLAADGGPVLLVDHSDNCNSGGTQDDTAVIAEALRQGLDGIAAGPICDPEAVAQLIAAGIGSTVTVAVGGKVPTPALRTQARPLTLTGRVRVVSDGRFVVRGPVFTGTEVQLGRTVVLDTGRMELLVSEGRIEPLDLAMFRFTGVEPTDKRFVIIKSKIQYRPTFGAMARHVVECNGTGVASLDYGQFRFVKVERPVHPLDAAPRP